MSAERIFSLAPLTVSGLSPPAIVAAASEAGYGHAGLRLHPASPGEAQWPVIGDTPMRRETRARLRDTGDRSGGTAAGIAAMPADLIAYFQICDLPAERPADVATMIYQARNARLPPGEGGIDVAGMVRALPPGLPISVEVPNTALAATMTASAYARLMLDRTRAFLRAVEGGQPDAA